LQEISESNQRRLEHALDLLDYGAQKPLLRYRAESNSFPQCYVEQYHPDYRIMLKSLRYGRPGRSYCAYSMTVQ
jgi:hypothetical protein